MGTEASSTKYWVVIPNWVRRRLGIKAGMREWDRIESLPLLSPRDLRGFLKGTGSDVDRDADRV